MSTRHLFLPFLIALAGIVSCNQLLPDDQQGTPRGYVTVDKQHYCNLTNVKGKDFEGSQKWVFNDGTTFASRCPDGAAAAASQATSASTFPWWNSTFPESPQCTSLWSAPKGIIM